MYSGAYLYGMDRKGRVVMPGAFRSVMGGACILTRGPEQTLLALSLGQWERLRELYQHDANFRAFYLGGAQECAFDGGSGRVLVPVSLREYAELRYGQEVTLAGLGRGVQIMERRRWEALIQAGKGSILGHLDLDLPAPQQCGRFQARVSRPFGFPIVRCSGRMHARELRRLGGLLATALNEKPARLWLDLRDTGDAGLAAGLAGNLLPLKGTVLWVLGEVAPPAGVRVLPNLEAAVWALEDGHV